MPKPKVKEEVISKPKPLKFDSGDSVASWNTFKGEWKSYEEASGLDERSSTERLVTFLRVVGKDAINIYNSFSWSEERDARDIEKVIEKFETLCLSDRSTRFRRYLFHRREQETGEKVDDYAADIRNLAESCGFGDLKETLIADKIIFGLKEQYVKEELLKSEEVESKKVVELIKARQEELNKRQREKFKAKELLKKQRQGEWKMADDHEMIEFEDDMNGEEEEDQENGAEKGDEDALILKADSDIEEEVQEDEAEGGEGSTPGKKPSDTETKETPQQTKRDTEFTSEDFKIELRGLPRYYAMGQLKKLLNETLQLKAHKIKPAGNNRDWAYITFRDEKSRTKALAVLDEYQWKKCTLTCSIAKAVEDPVAAKRVAASKLLDGDDPEASIPVNERIVKSVTPYAHRTYEDQLKEKYKAGLAALRKLGNEMAKTNPELKQWVKFHKLRRKGQVCEVDEIVQSPQVDGYRNKCEFTVGINPDDGLPTVGFRVSSYKSGSLAVGPVGHLVHIPESMKKVVKVFQEYVRGSDHKPFDPLTHEGVWRQLTVRTSLRDDILIAVVVHPQEFSEEELGDIKQDIVDYFRDGGGATASVTSIFFQAYGQKEPGPEEIEFEHLWGEEYITERVLGKTFRISCESFFQVNTKGCEALYETVASFAELDGTSVILDICCGTGTIGISLADQCLKVYGIEMVKKAAEDARHNAQLNGLENVAIYTGKAEVNMNAVMSQCSNYKSIGIVDPPRAGLPENVIRALRKCENMDHLVYLSCDPEGAFKNFIDLSRPKSKNYKGEFFIPIRAAIVDLFPHTPHYELLILFERWEERKWRRIMEGNPLPRDEDYFKRIPAKPDGRYQGGSSEEQQAKNKRVVEEENLQKKLKTS
ncbi:tRNA (uracil-5-)-methyltransferase homolog A-like isoform X3 [Macrobrachium rosenbergii]|uniref:tRNA (uracil-5-)-methyltransferase homolog A-like isoform X3 n=2 Tax=Macrobrachium rosenbergii TaxID=79674 RepID=UPI0034D4F2F9